MKKVFPSICTFVLALFILIASGVDVRACSCMQSGTVDRAFVASPNVVILTVRSIEKTAEPPPRLVNYGGIKQTTLTVEKVFKGDLKVGQEMVFAQGGGADCVWTFTEESINQEYLFYLGAGPLDKTASRGVIAATGRFPRTGMAKDVWIASTCSRSGQVKHRAGDLKYLQDISKLRGKTRLSGTMSRHTSAATAEARPINELLANYTLKLIGNGKNLELKTDDNGLFEIYDLPAGKYKLEPERVPGYRFYGSKGGAVEVEVKTGSHTEFNFGYVIDNSVRGKLYDSNGKSLNDVCLDLIPASGESAQYFHEFDCTEKDGSFAIDSIPAGRYVIVVNKENKISARQPFGRFYYPSARRREDAVEIAIGPGDHLNGLVINALDTLETITVTGKVRFENDRYDSQNAEFVSIEFTPNGSGDKDPESSRSTPDKDGNFKIRILKGQKGRLFGEMMTYKGEFENCPKLESVIRKFSGMIGTVKTTKIQFEAVADIEGIVLRFPFPLCKKRETDQ